MRNFLIIFCLLFASEATYSQCFLNLSVEPNEICPGETAKLTVLNPSNGQPLADLNYTYKWSTGQMDVNPIFVAPSISTTYRVTVTHSSGCQTILDRTVEVKDADFLNFKVEPSEICLGESATFTLTYPNGNPIGSEYSTSWSTGHQNVSSITVTPPVPGALAVYVDVSGGTSGCSQTLDRTAYVRPLPERPVITQHDLVEGGAFLKSDIPSVSWSTGQTGPCVMINSLGVYTATHTNQYGCTNSTSINVNEFAECGGDTTIVIDSTFEIHLDTTILIDSTFEIHLDTTINVIDTHYLPEIIPCPDDSTGGTDSTGTNGECDDPIVIVTSDDETISYGEHVFLTAVQLSGSPIASVQWLPAEGNCPTCLTNKVFPNHTTNYKLVVTGENPACKAVDSIFVCMEGDGSCETTNVANPESGEREISIYPNPVLSEGSIKFDLPHDSQWLVSFTSMDAKMVVQGLKVQGENPEIDISRLDLPGAIYSVSVLDSKSGKGYTQKLVVH